MQATEDMRKVEDIENRKFFISETFVWRDDGIPICDDEKDQSVPKITRDGSGGAIIIWRDDDGPYWKIYAQRINSRGSLLWDPSGIALCSALGNQNNYQIISDGVGGAIITWQDGRAYSSTQYDIYAQHINSSGHLQWGDNGVAVCNDYENQDLPQLVSDENGGAIITWEHYRGSNCDIYAQRINSSGGIAPGWTTNGTLICNRGGYLGLPIIISDGLGGAIITWQSGIYTSNRNVYAQRINSQGQINWTVNGVSISNSSQDERINDLVSDGNGGAIFAWSKGQYLSSENIYAVRLNSSGDIAPGWSANGMEISTGLYSSRNAMLTEDGSGGAIIVWQDARSSTMDLYAQKIDSNGLIQWTANGTTICDETGFEKDYSVISDNSGGAIITWVDDRIYTDDNIYIQQISASGDLLWTPNGSSVCTASFSQKTPDVVGDGFGGAIVVWEETRSAVHDIYAQYIVQHDRPVINNPENFVTIPTGDETINWTISDDSDPGKYRVLANNSFGNYYVWRDWTDWENNSNLEVPVNRTASGVFNYTIEYYDNLTLDGFPDSVIVIVSEPPTTNSPGDFTTMNTDNETIDWILTGDAGTGKYRVLANDSSGNYYVWRDWTDWTNNTNLSIPINQDIVGIINYTIEYYDNYMVYGISDSVIVKIYDAPVVSPLMDFTTSLTGYATLNWVITDLSGSGMYRVLANNSLGNYYIWVDWTDWTNNTNLGVPINRTAIGVFNYTIEYYDNFMINGTSDSIIVTIVENDPPTVNSPNDITTVAFYGTETIDWLISDDGGYGAYRVLANDSSGDYYLVRNWTLWTNDENLNVPIDRTVAGIFNYTIEYFDNYYLFGSSDMVIVEVKWNEPPTVSSPEDIVTTLWGTETIDWIITDDLEGGMYRVLVNDSSGDYYEWMGWTSWTNNTNLRVLIDRTVSGVFNYTIEYDDLYLNGIYDSVIVTVEVNNAPVVNSPEDIVTTIKGTETIDWIITDDTGPGMYRVYANNSKGNYYVWRDWTDWTNNTNLRVPINRTASGIFGYMIVYNDDSLSSGTPDIVIVTISSPPGQEAIPGFDISIISLLLLMGVAISITSVRYKKKRDKLIV